MSYDKLLKILEERFVARAFYHAEKDWQHVKKALEKDEKALETLLKMEATGGEPSLVDLDFDYYTFVDTSLQSPLRRSYCYDEAARLARKEHRPNSSALKVVEEMGARLLCIDEYKKLQEKRLLDTKTSSWLLTSEAIRKNGGAIYGESRFGDVFIGANGADSYYSSRGFRLIVLVEK